MGDTGDEVQTETIVLDNGSLSVKAGFGGEDAPRHCFPTVLGWPRHPGVGGVMIGGKKDNHAGHEAIEKRGLLSLRYPIERGSIVDWDDMEKVWHHAFYSELLVAPEEHPVLMDELPGTARQTKEKMAQMVFEVFNVPALYVANMAVLTLYSTGRTTGVVLESGDGQTHIVPVWEGYALPHHYTSMPFAGKDLTNLLMQRLRGEGYPFSTVKDREIVQRIKEQLCYVCNNYETECDAAATSHSYDREYVMPDDSRIVLTQDRFAIPEAMFQPHMVGHPDTPGVHQLIHQCVQRCDPDVRREMYNSCVVGGGNTLYNRFDERLQKEVQKLHPEGKGVKVVALAERQYGSWLGGSILASLNTFPCMWASKLEYDEFGVNIVHRKF